MPQGSSHLFGVPRDRICEIEAREPLEVSLFIGGREFPIDGVSKPGGLTLRTALGHARDELQKELLNPVGLEREASFAEMSVEELREFLVERLFALDHILGQVS
jgi:hypothetical protein